MVETRSGDLGDVVGLVPQRGKPLISPATTVAPNCGPNERRRGHGAAGGASTVRSLFYSGHRRRLRGFGHLRLAVVGRQRIGPTQARSRGVSQQPPRVGGGHLEAFHVAVATSAARLRPRPAIRVARSTAREESIYADRAQRKAWDGRIYHMEPVGRHSPPRANLNNSPTTRIAACECVSSDTILGWIAPTTRISPGTCMAFSSD
jgi:hypothetical protein